MASYYKSDFRTGVGDGSLPAISTEIDSVRTFQFECHFNGLPAGAGNERDLVLAAKKVGAIVMTSEDIVVQRANDKVYYPGKVTPEEVVITFDNIYLKETSKSLYNYFTGTYNPATGSLGNAADVKTGQVDIVMLNNDLDPHSTMSLIGVYPKKYSLSELQYAENQFHTIEVTFRFDYMVHS
mgnify:CR=1 FL=1|tara:strand:+ start:286 stop:831 length:546 start_codon:yes stop_codon:yes gene_type:complete